MNSFRPLEGDDLERAFWCAGLDPSWAHMEGVGAHPRLGGWDLNAAPQLAWTPGDKWVLELELPPLLVAEFKLAVKNLGPPLWQEGLDRKVALPCVGEGPLGVGAVEVEVPWDGAARLVADGPAAADQQGGGSPSSNGNGHHAMN